MTHALSVELTDSMQGAIALTMTEPQSEHLASIDWQRGKWADVKGKYSREHTSWLVGGAKIKASDAYFLLPEVYRDGAKVDPEKMFVATIASANMLLWRRRPRELVPPAQRAQHAGQPLRISARLDLKLDPAWELGAQRRSLQWRARRRHRHFNERRLLGGRLRPPQLSSSQRQGRVRQIVFPAKVGKRFAAPLEHPYPINSFLGAPRNPGALQCRQLAHAERSPCQSRALYQDLPAAGSL
jgi:hypothetical protein